MNKLVVVTGATKGIGRAIVDRFAHAGFDVAVSARTVDDLNRLKTEVESRFGVSAFVKPTDMSDKKQVKDFCQYVLSLQRPIEVLVNNAGYFIPGKITEETDGVLESMIESNLYSAYNTTRGLIAGMIKQKRGTVFNICSIASFMAYPNGGSYSISKFALLGFSKTLREELKNHGIRVTAIMPGATNTNSWSGSNLPESRFMKPDDVAEVIFSTYSLSERSVVEEIIIRPQLGDI